MASSKNVWIRVFLASGIVVAAVALGAAVVRRWHPTSSRTPVSPEGVYNVDVFNPDPQDWSGLREAVRAFAKDHRDKLGDTSPYKVIGESSDQILLKTQKGIIRFTWHDTLGARDTQEDVYHLATSDAGPTVVVGSSNTKLTIALATGLARARETRGGHGPLLIIPWAAAADVEVPEGSGQPRSLSLLDIYPDSSFRFCLNNRDAACRAIGRLMPSAGRQAPVQVLIAKYDEQVPTGTADPYATDLSNQIKAAIESCYKTDYYINYIYINRQLDDFGEGRGERADKPEQAWAQEVWYEADKWRKAAEREEAAEGRTTWLVIPFQQDPTRRLIKALQATAPESKPTDRSDAALHSQQKRDPQANTSQHKPAPLLQVLCGNGPSAASYAEISTAPLPFPIWFISSGYKETKGSFAPIVQAEVVAALVHGLEKRARDRPTEALRSFLVNLPQDSRNPTSVGRSVRFDKRTHERDGPDLGYLLKISAGGGAIQGERQNDKGEWEMVGPITLPSYD
jgi:hypothetical protein